MTPDYSRDETYEVTVSEVTDGDTLDVEFSDGSIEEVRVIGLDAPETDRNRRFERPQEWEGIEDSDYLAEWGANAKAYAKSELAGATVTVSFAQNEPIRDEFDRLLMFVEFTPSEGDGGDVGEGGDDSEQLRLYNRALVEKGLARVYGSGLTRHAEFWQAEHEARMNNVGLWAESDPAATAESRDRAVNDLFIPEPSSIFTESGPLPAERVPVFAEPTARQEISNPNSVVEYDRIPLAGIDADRRVGMIGGLLIDEKYEKAEGFDVDTANFENFVFLTNLIDYLSDRSGTILIDGGHGQFNAEYAISNEEAAYYQHYLEGQDGIAFEQINEFGSSRFENTRAILVSPPTSPLTKAEVGQLTEFRNDGGAVVFLGCAAAEATARENLNTLAARLSSDLRLAEDQVLDATHNVTGDSSLPYTTVFDPSFPLFDAYTPDSGTGESGRLSFTEMHANAEGSEYDNLNDEYLVFTNTGNDPLDLTGWTLQDEAEHRYAFPSGFTLAASESVTVHTGAETETSGDTDLYWGSSVPIWNNPGDTVTVVDENGSKVVVEAY